MFPGDCGVAVKLAVKTQVNACHVGCNLGGAWLQNNRFGLGDIANLRCLPVATTRKQSHQNKCANYPHTPSAWKAEPPPTRGGNRDSGTASAYGGRRLVRWRSVHSSSNLFLHSNDTSGRLGLHCRGKQNTLTPCLKSPNVRPRCANYSGYGFVFCQMTQR